VRGTIRKYTAEELKLVVEGLCTVFDLVRVVDPVRMTVEQQDVREPETGGENVGCAFALGRKCERCQNCVGLRAIQEGERQVKFEFADREIFHVYATPVEVDNRKLTLEIIIRMDDRVLLDVYGVNGFIDRITSYNARLQLDESTGLYSKGYFDARLRLLCRRAAMNKTDVAVAFLDVDGLERLAGDYGQRASDEALIAVGRLLTSNVSRRRGDFVARYGTNTFALVLYNIPNLQLRERMAEVVQRLAVLRLAGYGSAGLKTAMGVFQLSDDRRVETAEIPRIVAQRVEIARAAGVNRIAFYDR
jgi:putative two-component system response regulator